LKAVLPRSNAVPWQKVSAARRWWLTNLATLGGSRFQVSPGKQTKKKEEREEKNKVC
jgi:hypothetical protein